MAYGPLEILVVKFPGNRLTGEIAPALAKLTDTKQIRVIDLLFAIKDSDGTLWIFEQDGMGYSAATVPDPILQTENELLSRADAEGVSLLLKPNSAAVLLLFENVWPARFTDAMRRANGEVIGNTRAPREVIEFLSADSSALVA